MKVRRSILLVIVAAAVLLIAMADMAFAGSKKPEWQGVPENCEEIHVDDLINTSISTKYETITYKFIPPEDGVYLFDTICKEVSYSQCRILLFNAETKQYDIVEVTGGGSRSHSEEGLENNEFNYFLAKAGKTYYCQLKLNEKPSVVTPVVISLRALDLLKMEFVLHAPLQLRYLVDGSYGWENKYVHQYFYYDTDSVLPADNDEVKVTRKDGSTVSYCYDKERWGFVSTDPDSEDIIDRSEISFQLENDTDLEPGDYNIKVWYKGMSTGIEMSIIKTVQEIQYIPAAPLKIKECDEDSGGFTKDADGNRYFWYGISPKDKDQLIVTSTSDSGITYTYNRETLEFESEDGKTISRNSLKYTDEQNKKHWKPGKHSYKVSLGGKSCELPVTIVHDPSRDNPITVKVNNAAAKASVLKKKSVVVKKAQVFTVKNAKGKVTYKLSKEDSKAKKKITVASNGNITLKKGLKAGVYNIGVNVTAAGNDNYNEKTIAKTVKIVVKK